MTSWNADASHDEATQLSTAAYSAAGCRHRQAKSSSLQPIVGAPSTKHGCAQAGMAERASEAQSSPASSSWERTRVAARSVVRRGAVESRIASGGGVGVGDALGVVEAVTGWVRRLQRRRGC